MRTALNLSSLTCASLAAAVCLVLTLSTVQAKTGERGHRVPQLQTSAKSQYSSAQTKDGSKATGSVFRAEDIIPDICRGC